MTLRQRCLLFLFAVALASWIILLGWLDMSAKAGEGDTDQRWVYRTIRQQRQVCDWTGYCWREWYEVRRRYPNHTYRLPEHPRTRVHAYERRQHDGEYAGSANCKIVVRATGDDKLTQENAEISAQDRWSIEVETHFGSKFSDVRYSAQSRMTCVRKVPTSATEKGQAALGIRHHICAYSAAPCSAPAVRQDEDSRAKRRLDREEPTAPATRRDR